MSSSPSSMSISTSAFESMSVSSFGVMCLNVSLVLGLHFVFLCSFSLYVPSVNCISGDVDCSLGCSNLLELRESLAEIFSKPLTVSFTAGFGLVCRFGSGLL